MAAGPFEADLAAPFGVASKGGLLLPLAALYSPGPVTASYTFAPSTAGTYRFCVFGSGGAGHNNNAANQGGGGGAGYTEDDYAMMAGQSAAIAIGAPGLDRGGSTVTSGAVTSVTFGAKTLTVTPGLNGSDTAGGAGGVGSGGRINLSGGKGGTPNLNDAGVGEGLGGGSRGTEVSGTYRSCGGGGGAGPSLLLRGIDGGTISNTLGSGAPALILHGAGAHFNGGTLNIRCMLGMSARIMVFRVA